MLLRSKEPRIFQDPEYVEADERVRETAALLYDLKHTTPEDPDAIAKQRASHRAAIQSRREVLRHTARLCSGTS
jgi:hypothetical protein